ncbi:MAG: diaminopimelate decarboxylase [Corynebacterium sp.]|nr:diaminopimelate decarboxylase [Corynebacterium sp.]
MDFNALPAHVWPAHARREEDGVITIGGVPIPEITEEFGTPVFIVDEDDFRARCRAMAAAYGGPEYVHYASKAFLTATIAQWVDSEGLCLDVASEGELQVALAAGFPAARITAHGNNKTASFIRLCLTSGVGHLVVDAPQEIELIDVLAKRAGVIQPVLIRVKPGIEAHTHEFIATAHEDQKFGFSLASGSAYAGAVAAHRAENLRLDGLHCHVGSQVFDAQGFTMAAERVLGLLKKLNADLGVELEVLDLGGGYGIAYTEDQDPLDVNAVAKEVLTKVHAFCQELGIRPPAVMVEPGRAIAGPSTVTAYEVGVVKDVHVEDDVTRRYIAVDGGMSDNIRPALYGAEYDVRLANRFTEEAPITSRVVGSHCESGDILINNAELPADIKTGDIMVIPATGAYCYSMVSRYNHMLRPPVVSVHNGQATLMVRRETIEDVLRLENFHQD